MKFLSEINDATRRYSIRNVVIRRVESMKKFKKPLKWFEDLVRTHRSRQVKRIREQGCIIMSEWREWVRGGKAEQNVESRGSYDPEKDIGYVVSTEAKVRRSGQNLCSLGTPGTLAPSTWESVFAKSETQATLCGCAWPRACVRAIVWAGGEPVSRLSAP